MADIAYNLQLEKHLEDGFETVLTNAGCKVFRTRDTDIATSPRVEIVVESGAIVNHVYNFADAIRWAWNGWTGKLSTLIVTNRTETETRTQAHQNLLGLVRATLQQFVLCGSTDTTPATWPGLIVIITDIREAGTSKRFEDTNDLDYSQIDWALVYNINADRPELWE